MTIKFFRRTGRYAHPLQRVEKQQQIKAKIAEILALPAEYFKKITVNSSQIIDKIAEVIAVGIPLLIPDNVFKRVNFVYDEGVAKTKSANGLKGFLVFMVMLLILPLAHFSIVLATADTQTIVPNGDNGAGTNNWAQNSGTSDNSCSGGVDCDFVDEDGETDWLGTGTGMDGTTAEEEFDMTDLSSLGSFNNVTDVVLTINAGINGSCLGSGGSPCDGLDVRLFINGAYNASTKSATLTTSPADHTFTWNSLTDAAHTDIRFEIIRVANGGGSASAKDDDVRMYDVHASITYDYTITDNVQQTHFRWRDDSTDLDTDGGWLASEDSNSIEDIYQLQTYRVRMEAANVSSTVSANNYAYRLEYATKSGGSCSASSGWTRIDTASDAFEMVDTSHYTNQESLDNSRLTASEATFVAGDGMDTGDSSGSTTLAVDEYTEMEYSIRATSSSVAGTTYCFRMTNAGTLLFNYPNYPEVTIFTPPNVPYLTQEGYVFENDDRATQSGQSWGPNNPSTVVNDSSYGSIPWTNPSDASTSNDTYATVGLTDIFFISRYLKATNFGISISSGATITGIKVEVEKKASADYGSDYVIDSRVSIVKGGTIGSTDKKSTDHWPTSDAYISYGGSSDLWGETWTGADINSSDFGVAIAASYPGTGAIGASVDHIRITVYYNDLSAGSVSAGSEFTSGKVLSNVRAGERINLRTQLTNTGNSISSSDELALFYDRNDGIWTKVENQPVVHIENGNSDETPFSDGSADTTGLSNKWSAMTIMDADSSGDTGDLSMAIDPSGNPWVAYIDLDSQGSDTGDRNLAVAHYVGSGGNCDSTPFSESGADTSGLSDAWSCETIMDGDSVNDVADLSLAIDASGTPWVVYEDYDQKGSDTGERNLAVAHYVGSGGNCDSTPFSESGADTSGLSDAWDCETVMDGDSVNDALYSSMTISFDASSNPWLVYRDYDKQGSDTTEYNVVIAHYVGSGGNCDSTPFSDASADASGLSDAWDCETVMDGDSNQDALHPQLTIDASNTPWVIYRDYDVQGSDTTEINLVVAKYVGSGGNCDSTPFSESGADTSGLSDAWDCETVMDGDTLADGYWPGLAFDDSGNPWIAYEDNDQQGSDTGESNLAIARIDRSGEIFIAPSQQYSNVTVEESHADMTSATDTSNQSDADCLASSTSWNNGSYYKAENGTGLTGSAGYQNAQCTEVVWSLDTSQATPGATYRFVVATKDSFDPNSGTWRGPIAVATDGYPTLTIRGDEESIYRYSKDALIVGSSDCDDTAWSCITVDATGTTGQYPHIVYDQSGAAWISYYDDDTTDDLRVAHYVGSGGNCDDTGGSDAWQCTTVDATGDVGAYNSIAIDDNGVPWISYRDVSNGYFKVAHYVGGSSGSCGSSGGSSAWECTIVDSSSNVGSFTSIAIDHGNTPWTTYYEQSSGSLKIAKYVGSGGNCDAAGGSDAWNCNTIDSTDNVGSHTSIDFNSAGVPWVSYYDNTNLNLEVAQYVGAGGNCDSDAWQCTTVDGNGDVGQDTSLVFDSSDSAWVSYHDNTGANLNLKVAHYVGGSSGSCGSSGGSSAWDCTTVDATGDVGWRTSIAIDSSDNPWVSYRDSTGANLDQRLARYVSSGGNCDNTGGSDAWQCTTIDSTNDSGLYSSIAFDASGVPSVAYFDDTNDNLQIARLKLPFGPPSASVTLVYNGRNAGYGDLRYHLTSGLAPYSDPYGVCGGTSGLAGYCGLYHPDGYDDSITAEVNERPIYAFSTRYDNNNTVPAARVYFQTDASPASQNVVLQVYRYGSTNAWETVSTYTSAGCSSANCMIVDEPTGTTSEYFETDGSYYWMHYRLYQAESASSSFTFYLDSFTAPQTVTQLRHGRVFRENITDPLRW